VLLFSQLLLLVVGGPLMVLCEGADGHQAVELAHNNPCEVGEPLLRDGDVVKASRLAPEDCVDTSLALPPVLRHDDRISVPTTPIALSYFIVEFSDKPRLTPRATAHFVSPDSPEALARSVVLLI
jgi:hypothetical protein